MTKRRRPSGGEANAPSIADADGLRLRAAFNLLFDWSPAPHLTCDCVTGRIISANDAAATLLGCERDCLEGIEARQLFAAEDRPDAAIMLQWGRAAAGRQWRMERRDGGRVDAEIAVRPFQGDGGRTALLMLSDVGDRSGMLRRLEHMERHDGLTGLANRTHCRQHLSKALASASEADNLAVVILDLDNFKLVNEAYGHDCADALLSGAAARLRQFIPGDAFLARLGGDEFAIVLRGASPQEAERLAAALIALIAEPFMMDDMRVHVGATVGFACYPQDSRDPDALLRHAALALYSAKAHKRGTFMAFHAGMDAAAQDRSALENDFRHAVLTGALEVHYQPVVDLGNGATRGYEALLRWTHPERGSVSPEIFVPIAEETGLIDQIGQFVLETACRDAATWADHLTLSVNVSPRQFRGGNLMGTVIHALSSSGLSPERLELEVTEAVLIEKGPRPSGVIRNLRSFGIGIALDDFGTGYSSLSYLINYPFTKIKIDKSFILNLDSEPASQAVVRAIVGLGKSFGLVVCAEGIEQEAVREFLLEVGCTTGQGYLFGRAQPASVVADAAA